MDQWSEGSIGYILRNERYCGNVLTWKTFTADMFEHKHKRNNKDRDQYLYTDHHDAIISIETFEAAQVLLENRRHHYYGALPTLQVIDDGVFRGYIPINHHWINEDPTSYFEASKSVPAGGVKRIRKSNFSPFDFDGYQVVRGQFLSTRPECPCLTITNDRITFNVFCMRKFEKVKYVQLLLHPTERKLAIRPCESGDMHHIRWRVDPEKPFTPKTISCPHFGNALFQIMEWNPDYVYHIRGSWAARARDEIIVFTLSNAVPAAYMETVSKDAEETTRRRVDLCPEEWQDSFGDEFYDYALDNSFYFLAPKTDWKADNKSVAPPGMPQMEIKSDEDLDSSIEIIKSKVGSDENG
jgi:hypothetical protein